MHCGALDVPAEPCIPLTWSWLPLLSGTGATVAVRRASVHKQLRPPLMLHNSVINTASAAHSNAPLPLAVPCSEVERHHFDDMQTTVTKVFVTETGCTDCMDSVARCFADAPRLRATDFQFRSARGSTSTQILRRSESESCCAEMNIVSICSERLPALQSSVASPMPVLRNAHRPLYSSKSRLMACTQQSLDAPCTPCAAVLPVTRSRCMLELRQTISRRAIPRSEHSVRLLQLRLHCCDLGLHRAAQL